MGSVPVFGNTVGIPAYAGMTVGGRRPHPLILNWLKDAIPFPFILNWLKDGRRG